ncbi:MAG TPA: recombinase family protein [Candidatus Nitrosocosmicus sp.]|nr:recombinase family protein [Candidatus Nitrosocosmicus sp.]
MLIYTIPQREQMFYVFYKESIKLIGIYIRVSTVTQATEGYSLAAQKERLEAFCKAQGWNEHKLYIEEGISAKNDKRPVYQELMQHVREGKIKTVLVYKLDRIMRSLGELDKMLKTLEKHGCAFKSATEPFDTDNATGKLFIYLVGAFAQWEIELSSERIQMALEEKVSKGERVGGIPYPFDLGEDEKLVANEERSRVTLEMIEMLKAGYSSLRIADYLTKTNDDKAIWRTNTVLRILKNPALCGDTYWSGKVYENTHEGIISRDEFNLIQQILVDRSQTRRREVKSNYLFQGLLVCPSCGNPMSVNRYFRKRKGRKFQSATYRCQPCAKSREFIRTIGEQNMLKSLYKYMQNLNYEYDKEIEIKEDKPDYINQLETLERRRQKYQRAWASDLMTDEEFKTLMDETRKTYDELKEKANSEKPREINVEQIKNTIFYFNNNFKNLTNDEKRVFLSTFVRRINIGLIPQQPKRPDKHKEGRPLLVVTNIDFY